MEDHLVNCVKDLTETKADPKADLTNQLREAKADLKSKSDLTD